MTSLQAALEGCIRDRTLFGPPDSSGVKVDVPASAIRAALLAPDPQNPDQGQLGVQNLRVFGPLTLQECHIGPYLEFQRCEFDSLVDLSRAQLGQLTVTGCRFREKFLGTLLEVRWNLQLLSSDFMQGLCIPGARVGGSLHLDGSELAPEDPGDPESPSLFADRVRIGANLTGDHLSAKGEIRLLNAQVAGQLSLNDIDIECQQGNESSALCADGIEVGSGAFCSRSKIGGELRLHGATIGGQLGLVDATVTGHGDRNGAIVALSADGVQVKEDMLCRDGVFQGEVRLLGAQIGGQVLMNGATFDGRKGRSGSVFSIVADHLVVEETLFLGKGFVARGAVHMPGAVIKGQFSLTNGEISIDDPSLVALDISTASVGELFIASASVNGAINFHGATVNTLVDTLRETIAPGVSGRMILDNFTFRALQKPLDAKRRLAWIKTCQGNDYRPGIYMELADAFRRIGHSGDARQVEIDAERRAIGQMKVGRPRWLWNKLLWITTGSGHRNWLAGLWLLGLIGVGALLFWHCEADFKPITAIPPKFNPLLYAIDATVPVLEVGQQRAYAADNWLRWASLFLTVAGYVLVTAVIAAATGLLSRNQR